jgi:hypothetical protein
MKKLLFTVFFATAFVTAANVRMSALGSTSPAQTFKYFGCFVHEADGVQYLDLNFKVHEVRKYDEAGNLEFLHYSDHGTLPEDATLPSKTLHTTITVLCGGCIYEGTYREVITPSGEYHSSGPID